MKKKTQKYIPAKVKKQRHPTKKGHKIKGTRATVTQKQ